MKRDWAFKIADGVYEGFKTLLDCDVKADEESDGLYITGYANTKGKPDAYGDIPMGESVYDLSRFKKNPVALANHENNTGNVIGTYVMGSGATEEDEKGLKIKLKLWPLEDAYTDIAKHTIAGLKNGHIRAFSIGGRWYYEDKDNPMHLTRAAIHEISVVAIGADGNALTSTPKPKSISEITERERRGLVMAGLITEYRKTKSETILKTIQELRRAA